MPPEGNGFSSTTNISELYTCLSAFYEVIENSSSISQYLSAEVNLTNLVFCGKVIW